jgi:diguanylate cyclase (GGDEF)-like protein
MFIRLTNRLEVLSTVQIVSLSLSLVAVIGAIDYVTGYELSFSIFYLLPIAIASWSGRMRIGIAICIVSGITWYFVDAASGHHYSDSMIPVWNAGVRLSFFVVVAYLLDNLRAALDAQVLLARQDDLTGLLNAKAFRRACDSMFRLASRHDRSLAIGYLDVDDFRNVNNRFGHGVGDEVLQAIATVLLKRLRASDVGARLGGDEFAVLLPETDLAGAKAFFTELHAALLDMADLKHWPVGFSIGVAAFRHPTANTDEGIRRADDLMYRVKNSGKNGVLVELCEEMAPTLG